jgi:hypothetical protein
VFGTEADFELYCIPEHRWESSEEEEDVTAPGLIQGSVDSGSDESEDDEVMVSGEELEQADKSAFALLIASVMEESRYI